MPVFRIVMYIYVLDCFFCVSVIQLAYVLLLENGII
jgi:hypothetical protein